MSRYIRKERLRSAIQSLARWRANTQAQGSKHLFPLLSLIEHNIDQTTFKRYEEADDFAFFDKYFRVVGVEESPYFDPLTLQRRIASHPHSNIATARKNTFLNRWGAGLSQTVGDQTQLRLANDFDDTVVSRVMTRSGVVTRPNVIDISAWLFRQREFPDTANARDVLAMFRRTFPMTDEVYNKLFVFVDEPPDRLFAASPLSNEEIRDVVESTMTGSPAVTVTPPEDLPAAKSELQEDDPVMLEVKAVLAINSSGIIFRGCPGTGKTWYAWNVALELSGNKPENIHRVQFHSSYGYEDFVEGYRPNDSKASGFEIVKRKFLLAAEQAEKTEDPILFIIDEINRGDPARVFGEVLTYLEHGWREMEFSTPYSGTRVKIPRNLILLATMNPHDRSITQLDMALLRRFDHVDIDPSNERVDEFLKTAGMSAEQSQMVVAWFESLQKLLPFGLGHTYFIGVGDQGRLETVWRYRILPFCESVLEFEPGRFVDVKRSFDALVSRLKGQDVAGEQA